MSSGFGYAKNAHIFVAMNRAAICLCVGVVAEDEVDDVGAVPVLGDAHERLEPVVVAVRVEVVLRAVAVERVVAGPRPGRGHDVVLRVLVDPEREELHQLAGEVLVRVALRVRVVVEPDEHRGLERHLLHEVAEVAVAIERNSAFCRYIRRASSTL